MFDGLSQVDLLKVNLAVEAAEEVRLRNNLDFEPCVSGRDGALVP